VILALLFFATTINYIDRQIIGILKPYIAGDLSWSELDYGLIVTAFQIAYAVGLLFSGFIIDRFGTRLGYSVAVAVWSVAGMFHAAARNALNFAYARFFLGLGESANFPSAIKTVAEWFPQKERAHATGWFNSGSAIGSIVAPLIVSGITLSLGWRWAFIITGALGIIWIICWLLLYHPPLEYNDDKDIDRRTKQVSDTSISWKELFIHRQTYVICTTRFLSDWVWWFFLFWTPDFLNKTHGIDMKQSVLPLIIIYSMASVGGIAGGWLSSKMISMGISIDKARKRAILACAVVVLPVMLVPGIHNLWVSVWLIAFACAGHSGWASNIFTIVSDIYPENAVGSMTGLAGFAAATGGALSASFVGLILDLTGSYFVIFALASMVYLVNYILLKLLIPEIRPLDKNLRVA
jgi:ACS family hexuronate transporter-like MFS transporter